eukprot:scaffold111176_cov37-Prasinocladus_malaysianus.AAC.1
MHNFSAYLEQKGRRDNAAAQQQRKSTAMKASDAAEPRATMHAGAEGCQLLSGQNMVALLCVDKPLARQQTTI